MFEENFSSRHIYEPGEALEMADSAMDGVQVCRKRGGHSKESYFNCPAAFDIEVTSFIDASGAKCAIMYEWTFGLNGLVMIGRTWAEFESMCSVIIERLGLSPALRLPIYVHNLAYEFQFMRKHFEWADVFAVDMRKPIRALTAGGLEFRDSLALSGYKLETVGRNLHKYKARKMVGDLDYSKPRTSETPLFDAEIGYCVNDVQVVQAYIQECIEEEGSVAQIPMTKTGYVRRYVRGRCFGFGEGRKNYKRFDYGYLMQGLTLEPGEYLELKRAFQGGYTHASPYWSGRMLEGVRSMDLTSSYPTQLVMQDGYPMSKGVPHEVTSREDFEGSLERYACLFDAEFEGLESTFPYDSYISVSRCRLVADAVVQNGRIVSAAHLVTTITEQDFMIIRHAYRWRSLKVGNMIRYHRGYLPRDFVLAVLELYKAKTELKGLQGEDPETGIPYAVTYMSMKARLNSCFGMCVTDIVRPGYVYEGDEWGMEPADLERCIEEYDEGRSRFLFYPWGVWNTAFARAAVWSAIFALGEDYAYCDTDSVKYLHPERHEGYFADYNAWVGHRLTRALEHHGISGEYAAPANVYGESKPLGVWDFDGQYAGFKALGAKRYLVLYSDDPRNGRMAGRWSLTVSGLNKSAAMPWLLERYGEGGIWDAFSDGLYIPPEATGKNIHTYIDDERRGMLTDYMGHAAPYHELSGVHLGGADYSLSISQEYLDFIMNVQEEGQGL